MYTPGAGLPRPIASRTASSFGNGLMSALWYFSAMCMTELATKTTIPETTTWSQRLPKGIAAPPWGRIGARHPDRASGMLSQDGPAAILGAAGAPRHTSRVSAPGTLQICASDARLPDATKRRPVHLHHRPDRHDRPGHHPSGPPRADHE